MGYNKETQQKYKMNNLERYKLITQTATAKWREKNLEQDNLKAKNRMRIYNEWKRLRNIEIHL